MKVMVGGTFDPLHDGHKKLLERSFDLAGEQGEVIIGLSGDQFAFHKEHSTRPFSVRKSELEEYLTLKNYPSKWEVEELHDKYGSTLDTDFDAIVVSEETFKTAVEINKMRKEKQRRKVDIHQITCVLAKDGKWISSTRIWRGEIDTHGNLINL